MRRAKEIKCSVCEKPCLSGKRGMCDYHYAANQKAKAKEKAKAEKAKAKRAEQRGKITEAKLDAMFSQLVKVIYKPICHSRMCQTESPLQAAHFIGRSARSVRWDLRNVYPVCREENFYNQLHVLELAKRIREYYDIDPEELIAAAKQTQTKLSFSDRAKMFVIFKDALEECARCSTKTCFAELRNKVIESTKFVM